MGKVNDQKSQNQIQNSGGELSIQINYEGKSRLLDSRSFPSELRRPKSHNGLTYEPWVLDRFTYLAQSQRFLSHRTDGCFLRIYKSLRYSERR